MHPIINKEICLITNSFVQDEEVSIDYGITWTSSSNLVQSVTGDGNKLDLKVDMSLPKRMRIKIKTEITTGATKVGEWQYINLLCMTESAILTQTFTKLPMFEIK